MGKYLSMLTASNAAVPPVMVSQMIAEAVAEERERIARAGADFFQNRDYSSWVSSSGRWFEDLGNGWNVGYELMMEIIIDKPKCIDTFTFRDDTYTCELLKGHDGTHVADISFHDHTGMVVWESK